MTKNTFWNSIEISASVFPLVSGTALAMNMKPVVEREIVFASLDEYDDDGDLQRRQRSKSKSTLALLGMS